MATETTITTEPFAPRTYQSAWQWNEDGTAKLMTAEEWLAEEGAVDAALDDPDDGVDDGPKRSGILRAIAKEVATLRAERTQWAEQATRQADALAALTPEVVAAKLTAIAEYHDMSAKLTGSKTSEVGRQHAAWARYLRDHAAALARLHGGTEEAGR